MRVATLMRLAPNERPDSCLVCGGPVRRGEERYRLHGGPVHLACATYRMRTIPRARLSLVSPRPRASDE